MEQQHSEWDKLHLKGKIKSAHRITYQPAEVDGETCKGEIDNSPYSNVVWVFDKDGRLLENTFFRPDGSISFKTVTVFEGNRAVETRTSAGHMSLSKTTYQTRKGRIVKSYLEGEESIWEYSGKNLVGIWRLINNDRVPSILYEYDGDKLIKETYYDIYGQQSYSTQYSYQDDHIKHEVQKNCFMEDNVTGCYITKYIYDIQNDVIAEKQLGVQRQDEYFVEDIFIYTYEYDVIGNWIIQREYDKASNILTTITEKTIEYF